MLTLLPENRIFPCVTFTEIGKGIWQATDKADKYDIIRGSDKVKGTIFAAFKNQVIAIGVETDLPAAIQVCEAEQKKQEWFSNNPENADTNNKYRKQRRTSESVNRKSRWHLIKKIIRPNLYKGRKNRNGE